MTRIDPELLARCAKLAQEGRAEVEPAPTGLDGVTLVRATSATDIPPRANPPMICLVLQGAKEILHHDRWVRFGAGDIAIVSHDLVPRARIVEATKQAAYLAIASEIDASILRALQDEIDPRDLCGARAAAVTAGTADQGIIDTMGRFLTVIDTPLEQKVILPLIRRELHFRALLSRQGYMLRQLARHDSHASRISRAITHIRTHWNNSIGTDDLAELAGMSRSSFHAHFKDVTATSPLQYQKSLRLAEARRQLTQTGESVSSVAFSVGYESPTQFSRDYRRTYGVPPMRERTSSLGA